MSTFALRALIGQSQPAGTLVIDAASGATSRVSTERAEDCPFHVPIRASLRLALGPRPTVRALLDALGPGRSPLSWMPILERLECRRGHHAREAWGVPRTEPCPVCGAALRARTTLEIQRAPGDATLASLGVAPREILAVRERGAISHAELC